MFRGYVSNVMLEFILHMLNYVVRSDVELLGKKIVTFQPAS